MHEKEAGHYWNENADVWTKLARAGYDVYRDQLNTPAFFSILPGIKGLNGIDIGCGEGHNTRLLAKNGARMDAIDISPVFIGYARQTEKENPLGIRYTEAMATGLPYEDACFDFATSFMCLMDMPAPEKAMREAFRVLKPGGFFQFSIEHPCFNTPYRKNLRDERGITYAIEVGGYFQQTDGTISEWIFGSAPEAEKRLYPKFKVPAFHRTLSFWINSVIQAGFVIEQISEPRPDDEVVKLFPYIQDSAVVSYFLHIRCRKPD